jgi:two-component system, sensor histidine kinase PdtaS
MDNNVRPSEIEGLVDMSWGTHFCLFYETQEDLLDILIPYFKVGLANHEFCFCVAAEPVITEEAKQALHKKVPGFEQYLSEGQIEIISHMNWYLKDGYFDPLRVRQGWMDKLEQALARGYAGMRFAANISWLKKQDWDRFAEYEGTLEEIFRQSQMIGICAYNLEHCPAHGILDVVRHHQFTLARQNGRWEPLEGTRLKHAHQEMLKLNADLERRVAERTAELLAATGQLRREIAERKWAEEALLESEYKLNEAERLAHIGYWEHDYQADRITWSAETYRIVGISPEEQVLTAARVWELIQPEDRQRVVDAYGHALRNGSRFNIEYRIVRPNGEVRIIHTLGDATCDESGQPRRIFGVLQDITERKQAEEALCQVHQDYVSLVNSVDGIVWEADAQTFAFLFVSHQAERLLGYPVERWLAVPTFWKDHIHPDDRDWAINFCIQSTRQKRPHEFEYRMIAADEHIVWLRDIVTVVVENDQPVRLRGLMVDMTASKKAEALIRQQSARSQLLADISRTFAQAGLDYQGILNTVARRTAELIGDSCVITLFSDDNQRAFPVAFHHPDPKSLSLMQEALLHIWQGGTDTVRFQMLLAGESIYIPVVNPEEYRAQSEPEFWHYVDTVGVSSVLIVPLKPQGHVIGTLGITRDHQGAPYTQDDLTLLQNIADRAAMSIQNAQLFRQVEGAREQLEALSRRLLEVQEVERRALTTELHDRVGQNLTGLSINLQNMKALLSGEAAQILAKKFDDAQSLVEDTARQIRDIMAELHLPELEDYGLAAALETYAERVASRGNLELIANLPDLAPPPLPSEVRIALFRAAQEAISNVLKHANATQLEISLQGENGRVRLRVEDDGQGFEPEAPSQKEASTWGLKIMRERIESIGGKVQIESEPGQGTRVTFEIERSS